MAHFCMMFKVYLGKPDGQVSEVRRFCVDTRAALSFAFVRNKIRTLFPSLLDDRFCISWFDGVDLVSIDSDEEMVEALSLTSTQPVKLYLSSEPPRNSRGNRFRPHSQQQPLVILTCPHQSQASNDPQPQATTSRQPREHGPTTSLMEEASSSTAQAPNAPEQAPNALEPAANAPEQAPDASEQACNLPEESQSQGQQLVSEIEPLISMDERIKKYLDNISMTLEKRNNIEKKLKEIYQKRNGFGLNQRAKPKLKKDIIKLYHCYDEGVFSDIFDEDESACTTEDEMFSDTLDKDTDTEIEIVIISDDEDKLSSEDEATACDGDASQGVKRKISAERKKEIVKQLKKERKSELAQVHAEIAEIEADLARTRAQLSSSASTSTATDAVPSNKDC